MGLVYATRIGAPALNAILPAMCTNYREQSDLGLPKGERETAKGGKEY